MLKNVRHEAFAAAYAVCGNAAEAYRQAGYKAKDADSAGPRLLGNVEIVNRIDEIRKTAHDKGGEAVLTLLEKRMFLASVVRAGLDTTPPKSPLWQEITRTRRTVGRGEEAEEWEVEKLKLPDKLAAIKIDNEMSGDNAPVKITGSLTIDQLFPGTSFLPESIPASK